MDNGKSLARSDLKLSLNPSYADDEPTGAPDGSSISFASAVGFSFLTLNSGIAIYHSRHDPRSVLFVSVCFVDLVLLFHLLRIFERLPRGSPRRLHVKAAVWALTTILTVLFSQRVAALMPAPVAVIVWVMAAVTIIAGFVMFFVLRDREDTSAADEKPASKFVEGP